MKRTTHERETLDDSNEEHNLNTLVREAKSKLVACFACTAGEFELRQRQNRSTGNKIQRILRDLKTVHTLHSTVYKRDVPLRFSVDMPRLAQADWSELPPAELRCLLRLTDALQLRPLGATETETDMKSPPDELDDTQFVLHSVHVVRSSSNFPGRLMLASNMHDQIVDYYNVAKEKNVQEGHNMPAVPLPDLPSENGMATVDSGTHYYDRVNGKCIAPHPDGYLMPTMTRVLGAMDSRRLREGVVYVDDWRDTIYGTQGRYGIVRNDHFLAIYARTNDKRYNLAFHLLSSPQAEDDFYYVLLPADLIEMLVVDIEERMSNVLPFVRTDEALFELRRHGNIAWTSERGLDEGAELLESYEVEVVVDMSYTLFNRTSEKRNYISVPEFGVPISRIDNRKEMDAHLRESIQHAIDESAVEFDFSKFSMNSSEPE